MSRGKRRDKKGRVLHLGEYQEASGRYYYRYKDVIGKRRTVYSWRLIPTDRAPQGIKIDCAFATKSEILKKKCLKEYGMTI